jgi:GcrA cell cycle regulator
MRGEHWTIERIELLRKLWADGETAAAIAVRLGGMSRSAVMGKVFRLRLPAGDQSETAQAKQNTEPNNQRDEAAVPVRRRRGGARKTRLRPLPATGVQGKKLLELTNNTCRWPHGSPGTNRFFFCGAPEADLEHGVPYCARHMQRAYPGFTIVAVGGSAVPRGGRSPLSASARFDRRAFILGSDERARGKPDSGLGR